MPLPEMQAYFEYLRGRSFGGYLYRKYFLYPKLSGRLAGKVLDFGCGIGDFIRFRANTIGADINGHNVNYCLQRGLDVRLIEDNRIPFADDCFDGVVLDNVLEHIPSDGVDSVLQEIRRVLKSSGTTVVGVPGLKGYESDADHKVYYTEEGLTSLFVRHGFERREVFLVPFASKKLERILRPFCVYAVFAKSARPLD